MSQEICRVDSRPVLVNIFRGSGICSVDCEKTEAAQQAVEDARRCTGETARGTRCRRTAPAGAGLPWTCPTHLSQPEWFK